MRKFLLHSLLFIIFLLVIYIPLHFYMISLPNDYKFKDQVIKEKISDLKILCLGNSQMLFGVNPEYFGKEGFNLAHVSQTLDIDYLLFDKYNNELNNLEYLIVQMSYISPFESLGYEGDSWRILNYERYYSVFPKYDKSKRLDAYTVTERHNLLKLESSLKRKKTISCNEYGFDTSYKYENRLETFTESAQKALERHKAKNHDFLQANTINFEQIINKAKSKGIKIIILTLPVHESYYTNIDNTQLNIMYELINKTIDKDENIVFIDWMFSKQFDNNDFYDCDHLNDMGAKKLTLKLDSIISCK